MNKIGFIIIILLFSNVYCQTTETKNKVLVFNETLNEHLQDYLVEIIIRYTSLINKRRWDPATISVISKDYKDTLSNVDQGSFKIFSSDKEDYNFEDINFDGYKDLLIYNFPSANGLNRFYSIFIYNPKTNELIYDENVSNLLGVNTEIDSVKKQVTTYSDNPRFGESESATYKYIDGEWEKIK